MRELINNVIEWASARNIIQGSNVIKQLDKTSEEFNELQRALAVYHWLSNASAKGNQLSWARCEVTDAYGDILVTLIIAAAIDGIDLEECLSQAYEVIRHRKGKLINGKFVKEADLPSTDKENP